MGEGSGARRARRHGLPVHRLQWDLDRALRIVLSDLALGKRVVAGGPALFLKELREELQQPLTHELEDLVEIGGVFDMPDASPWHNPMATNASYGCPTGCWWCIVPAMHGRKFTLAPEFTPRPVLCDNNLSALPVDYQEYIVEKYLDCEVPLLDANSGFEARYFDERPTTAGGASTAGRGASPSTSPSAATTWRAWRGCSRTSQRARSRST
jgi:hypothetical protein